MFQRIQGDWSDKPVFLIGGGPSLRGFDFERLRGAGYTIAINKAIEHVPWADCVFTLDTVWFEKNIELLRQSPAEKVIAVPRGYQIPPCDARFTFVERIREVKVSADPATVYSGDNSGFGALNVACLKNARLVYLLGYDLNPTGQTHWHAGYDYRVRYGQHNYLQWAQFFHMISGVLHLRGVKVFNCSERSSIRCFPFANIDEVIRGISKRL